MLNDPCDEWRGQQVVGPKAARFKHVLITVLADELMRFAHHRKLIFLIKISWFQFSKMVPDGVHDVLGNQGAAGKRYRTVTLIGKSMIAIEPVAKKIQAIDPDWYLIDLFETTHQDIRALGDIAVGCEENTVNVSAFVAIEAHLV